MKSIELDFDKVEQFSASDVAYATRDERFQSFLKYNPNWNSFPQVIRDKQEEPIDRVLLTKVLRAQYASYTTDTEKALSQVKLLENENTFTIVTAHQPVLFTGPSYVIYKIISAIKTTQVLKENHPDFDFIPVFISGGEDHDFDEMDHTNLFGKAIVWSNDEEGSVARMSTKSLTTALEQLEQILGNAPAAKELFALIHQTHTRHAIYGKAFADLINGLLGHMGVVVLNMDEPALKERMKNIFKDELLHHHSAALVRDTQSKLENEGLKAQAFARDINLFYLDNGMRSRIEKDGDSFVIVDTDLRFTEEQILDLLENSPEKFSPNVIIRPLYQEKILPNLAYVGGGGELAYWLERKSQFDFFGINFPMLIRRDSCLWIDKGSVKKMAKLDLDVMDFMKSEIQQIKDFVAANAEHEFSLSAEKDRLSAIWEEVALKADSIDSSLKAKVASEGTNQIKSLEKIEDRLRKAEKQKHEIAINQIQGIREKFYPSGGLQERFANFMEFYVRQPDTYFNVLLEHFDPLDMRLKIIVEE